MRWLMALVLAVAVCAPRVALAAHSTVPDDYPTIQAAIDAVTGGSPDTVYVRSGDYAETLHPEWHLWLIGIPAIGSAYSVLPRVTSIVGAPHTLRIQGLRFTGPALLTNGDDLQINGCWFESGLTVSVSGYNGFVRNNVIMGDAHFTNSSIEIAMNTVLKGSLTFEPPGRQTIHDNVVIGSPTIGIECGSDAYAARNYVSQCVDGISTSFDASGATDNVVEDCSGVGIRARRGGFGRPISGNVIRRCGRGIEVRGSPSWPASGVINGNVIEDARSEGIYARDVVSGNGTHVLENNIIRGSGGRGIDVDAAFRVVRGNRVLVAGGDGIVMSSAVGSSITGNIVGHCYGRGIVSTGPGTYRNNTSYSNRFAGYELTGTAADSVDHNIAYDIEGAGLQWSGVAPVLGCNDWYANSGGNTVGVAPGATDVSLDPLFCDAASNDVGLMAGSPLASLAGCGLVGALGVGCTVSAVDLVAPAGRFGLEVMPTPSTGTVRFAWNAAAAGGELAVFDVTGQRRWTSRLSDAQGELSWRGVSSGGQPLAPGVYFARLTAGGHASTRRVVLVP